MANDKHTSVKINKNGSFLRNVPLIGKRQHMIVRTDMDAKNGVIHEVSNIRFVSSLYLQLALLTLRI